MPSAEFITMKVARFITIPVTTKVVRAVAWGKGISTTKSHKLSREK